MQVNLISFSQTGNTRAIADEMAGVFRKAGNRVKVISLDKATRDDAMSADLFGVGAPCLVSQAPAPSQRQSSIMRSRTLPARWPPEGRGRSVTGR
jgi:hypothetical protein